MEDSSLSSDDLNSSDSSLFNSSSSLLSSDSQLDVGDKSFDDEPPSTSQDGSDDPLSNAVGSQQLVIYRLVVQDTHWTLDHMHKVVTV